MFKLLRYSLHFAQKEAYCYSHKNTFQTTTSLSRQKNEKLVKIKLAKIIDTETLNIIFENGTSCNFKHIWLRDNCRCTSCVDAITKHKLNEFSISNLNVQPLKVELSSEATNLTINWNSCSLPDEKNVHCSNYESNWLSQFSDIFSGAGRIEDICDVTYNNGLPAEELWCKQNIENIDLKVSYQEFMNKDSGLFDVVGKVHKYGLAILKNVPTVQNEVVKVSERIAFVQETGYGRTFQIKINPHPKTHLTYTGKRFELHTDLSYFQNAPGAQLIHCIKAANPETVGKDFAGGISFFADAFHSIDWLRKEHPEYFHLLSTIKVPLAYLDAQRNRWIRRHRTLIETNSLDQVTDFYCTDFSMRPPLIREDKIVPFYKAYHGLMSKASSESSLFKFYLSAGDLVIFNNKRILHGRDEYDPSKVERHLEGCYLDLQEVTALYEKMYTENKNFN